MFLRRRMFISKYINLCICINMFSKYQKVIFGKNGYSEDSQVLPETSEEYTQSF